ncbi:MAG: protein translocase subunit SecD [Candidatus Moranbacteria bacterium]|nr:protein translocase subunit SecD [Candidatus Moranbacteria bacterium]
MTFRQKMQLKIFGVVLLGVCSGILAYPQSVIFFDPLYQKISQLKISLGLDLQGGVHLEYNADVSTIPPDQRTDAIAAVQSVVERRVNAFGVGEPLVQTAQSEDTYRIIVELPGVKDIEEAKGVIKETPILEFKEERPEDDPEVMSMLEQFNAPTLEKAREVLERVKAGEDFSDLAKEFSQDPGSKENGGDLDFVKKGSFVPEFENVAFDETLGIGTVYPDLVESAFGWHIIKIEERRGEGEEREVRARHILFGKITRDAIPDFQYQDTGLTGRYLEKASVDFGGGYGLGEPTVILKFNEEGTQLFKEITERNIGKSLAIFIDGEVETAPTVQDVIPNGVATITGNYSLEDAQELKTRLDEGALPVPLELVGQQSIEASLGQEELSKSLKAGAIGILAVMLYMIFYYRLFGLVASIAILIYTAMLVSIFKLSSFPSWDWPITLTLSGIAGFILSIGMAVDANVLIFERIKEELRYGKYIENAVREGFRRAWTSIVDGNVSTLLTAIILIWVGTGFVQGFAIILFIGVSLSMFTAVVIVRVILNAMPMSFLNKHIWLITSLPKKNKKNT